MGWQSKIRTWGVARALGTAFLFIVFANEASACRDWTCRTDAFAGSQSERLIELGKRLFFDARLSRTGRTACANCHDPNHAFAEPRQVSIRDDGHRGERNAPSLLDIRYVPLLMWDGRFRSLEEQAFNPFRRNGELGREIGEAVRHLNADPEYLDLFQDALGHRPTAEGLTRALAAYQRTLTSGPSRFDRFQSTGDLGRLTSLEHEGFAVFNGKGRCAACHVIAGAGADRPELFTDFRFHNLGAGRPVGGYWDAGRYRVTRASGDAQAFRTPSLRNVTLTAPYMHDGGLATLEDVIDFYDRGGRPNPNLSPLVRPLSLTNRERHALVAFLQSLTDEDLEQSHAHGLED